MKRQQILGKTDRNSRVDIPGKPQPEDNHLGRRGDDAGCMDIAANSVIVGVK